MVTLKDYKPSPPKILILGPMGTGKTLLATTLGPRALLLDLNNGLSSARKFKDKFTEDRLQCDVKCCWDVTTPAAMWQKTLGYVTEFCRKPTHEVLVIDGLTDLAEAALGCILQAAGKWDEANVDKIVQADWGNAIMLVRRMFYRLKIVAAAVVVLGHTKLVTIGSGRDAVDQERISIYGKNLGGDIEALMDEVWYTKVMGGGASKKFMLQTVTSGGVQSKTRLQLPDATDMNLGLPKILEMIGWSGVPVTAVPPAPTK